MGQYEIGNGAPEDNAETLGIDAPAHDAKRVRPKMLAGMLDLRRAAIPGAQYDRRGAVTEQIDGDNVGLGEFVVAKRQRAEFDSHQQHVGAWSRLCKARGDRQPRRPTGAAEAEYR